MVKLIFLFSLMSLWSIGGDFHTQPSKKLNRAQKDPAVLVYGYSDRDQEFSDSKKLEVKKLKNCGFDVREMALKDTVSLDSQLKGLNLPSDVPVFISAGHGSVKKSPTTGFQGLRLDPEGYDIPASTVIDSIRAVAPRSSIYVDVCHAGLCRDGKCEGLGTSCSAQQLSSPGNLHSNQLTKNDFPVTNALSDLYCESINECDSWKEFDNNKDGVLEGSEINQAMLEKLKGLGAKGENRAQNQSFNNWEDAKSAEKQCEAQKNKFGCFEVPGGFDLKFSKQYPDGRWKHSPSVRELAAAQGHRENDIPTFTGGANSTRDFSLVTKSLITGKWPEPNQKDALKMLSRWTGIEILQYEVSASGNEIEGKDDFGKRFKLRLDSFAPSGKEAVIHCYCQTGEQIPRLGEQQVFFDSKFKIPCRK